MSTVNEVWIVSDNFVAKMYREHFLLRTDNEANFIKDNFEFKNYCNSRFSSTVKNMMVRLQNTFAAALNKNEHMPKYVLIILDEDIISFINCDSVKIGSILGSLLSWLVAQIKDLIKHKCNVLLKKAKRSNEPCVYFCAAPTHVNFSHVLNEQRKKFNFTLEALCKNSQEVDMIKIKEIWDFNDKSLVKYNKITDVGFDIYWDAIEAAFRYNSARHKNFLIKSAAAAL